MEIRVLRYFLEIAREENMTRAAERLHISQPSLSRQMKELETELGKKLFVRSSYSIHLTNEGMLLRKRAEDLLEMADKITNEFKSMDDIAGGDVYIGCAESYLIKYLAFAVKRLNQRYPGIHYHTVSGDTEIVAERLDRGLSDMAFIVEPPDLSKYNYLEVPENDTWGAIMRKDCPLAEKKAIQLEDLLPYPVFCSEQSAKVDLPRWCGEKIDQLNIMATFNLTNNGAVFVREGLGIALTFDRIIELTPDSELCFRPISPALHTKMYVIWKKYQVFTPAAQLLLDELKQVLQKKD
ncbi:Hca operon transcriptional activator [[Eubacterium] contortum]|uniref:Hca operon transcriptional activator n=1 Tax=Faecalicatena contorta TaxID=39482 RepID=A0A174G9B6_9FIRM|nr:LysR family transcriptional regulator [Faecalicatena contorta]MBS6763254.1 LysR family transcriptional regulator [Clostridium sp.]CUO59062.1 Hca operon transcriptional activator [[Eubacterium] contortum] [Faecalicatena contorta]